MKTLGWLTPLSNNYNSNYTPPECIVNVPTSKLLLCQVYHKPGGGSDMWFYVTKIWKFVCYHTLKPLDHTLPTCIIGRLPDFIVCTNVSLTGKGIYPCLDTLTLIRISGNNIPYMREQHRSPTGLSWFINHKEIDPYVLQV